MPGFFKHETQEERSLVLFSFFTLFGILAGHTLLETARDALFVTRVSPTHLPFVYIAIALIGVLTSRLTGLGSGAARYYTITRSGRSQLKERVSDYDRVATAIARVMGKA